MGTIGIKADSGTAVFYAKDSYYIWNEEPFDHEVVEPPPDIEVAGTTEVPPTDRRSAKQSFRSRICHYLTAPFG